MATLSPTELITGTAKARQGTNCKRLPLPGALGRCTWSLPQHIFISSAELRNHGTGGFKTHSFATALQLKPTECEPISDNLLEPTVPNQMQFSASSHAVAVQAFAFVFRLYQLYQLYSCTSCTELRLRYASACYEFSFPPIFYVLACTLCI